MGRHVRCGEYSEPLLSSFLHVRVLEAVRVCLGGDGAEGPLDVLLGGISGQLQH